MRDEDDERTRVAWPASAPMATSYSPSAHGSTGTTCRPTSAAQPAVHATENPDHARVGDQPASAGHRRASECLVCRQARPGRGVRGDGHSTLGTMDLALNRYAQRFAAAGFAVLGSTTAISVPAGASPGNGRRASLGGGLAPRSARTLPQVEADAIRLYLAECGHVGGTATRRSGWWSCNCRSLAAIVGELDTVAVFSGIEEYAAAGTLAAEAPPWRNEMAARSMFSMICYRPGRLAGRLVMRCWCAWPKGILPPRCRWGSGRPSGPHGELRAIRGATSPHTRLRRSCDWSPTRWRSCEGTCHRCRRPPTQPVSHVVHSGWYRRKRWSLGRSRSTDDLGDEVVLVQRDVDALAVEVLAQRGDEHVLPGRHVPGDDLPVEVATVQPDGVATGDVVQDRRQVFRVVWALRDGESHQCRRRTPPEPIHQGGCVVAGALGAATLSVDTAEGERDPFAQSSGARVECDETATAQVA